MHAVDDLLTVRGSRMPLAIMILGGALDPGIAERQLPEFGAYRNAGKLARGALGLVCVSTQVIEASVGISARLAHALMRRRSCTGRGERHGE
jgi:hypothetical protein